MCKAIFNHLETSEGAFNTCHSMKIMERSPATMAELSGPSIVKKKPSLCILQRLLSSAQNIYTKKALITRRRPLLHSVPSIPGRAHCHQPAMQLTYLLALLPLTGVLAAPTPQGSYADYGDYSNIGKICQKAWRVLRWSWCSQRLALGLWVHMTATYT